MSETSEKARSASKAKAEKLVRADPKARVDASGYTPDGAMDADVAMGMRPVSRRAYKSGGKVEGEKAPSHAGRKPRKSGGPITPETLINRNVKTANEDRGGITHVGGMKSGGSVHESGCECAKCGGGRVGRAAGGAINDGTRPVAGRLARKAGGRAKKGTNVNIIITQPQPAMSPRPMPPPGAPPPAGPPPGVGLHQGAPAPMIPAGAMPVQAPPGTMGRKSGGRVDTMLVKPGRYPIKDGAGGGFGRREKAKAYGL